ncbi:LysM domain-containing protein [Tissierella sp. Yu-01]|uniref:LysM peptidoglycan-binding domain-containing protein n=1 Tax=Tissierella sp. Yu-01 TaxID=3035694 RepID=UPI00240D417A|nr:LysM domain-containing protein [Tissierella sp. Yu-01]WFA09679.1 LysM domain-containing protein [Tissierella sp. Yu-01]
MEKKLIKNNLKFRPLTKNEKFLLSILVIIFVFWASNRFILTPQAEKISQLESEKLELDTKIVDINNTLKRENNIKEDFENLYRERNEILANYFPTIDQSQIIYLLNDLLSEENIDITDFSFSRPTNEQINEMIVQHMDISIPFKGDYDGIINIVKSVETSPRRILVDTLSMDKTQENISGNVSLKIYSLDGIADTDSKFIDIDVANGSGDGSLFEEYEGYVDESISLENEINEVSSREINDIDYTKVYMLHDFETKDYSFIPSNELIRGDATPSTTRKSGKYSLRFEYNMLALEEENRAYIDLNSKDIEFKYPPDLISMWVNAYGYSPGTLGMRLRTQGGEDIDVTISEGISWLGWSSLEASPPVDLSLYPLKLTHLYFELPYNRDDIGVFLIDKLEAFYPVSEDSTANNNPINDFYVVQHGDTATSISMKFYGTIAYKNEIIKNNSLTTGDTLPVGKVLVLIRR